MAALDYVALAQPGIRALRAYDPGLDLVALRRRFAEGALVELGSNENSHGPSPAARAAILDALHALHRYPDPLGGDLKRALAACHGVDPASILLGNGSHELLMMLAQAFAGPGRGVVSSQYGFAVYGLAAAAAGAPFKPSPVPELGWTSVRLTDDAADPDLAELEIGRIYDAIVTATNSASLIGCRA